MDLVDLIETRRFLGGEFLMWLWFKSACMDNLLPTKGHGTIEVWIAERLTLEAYVAETERNAFQGGAPAHAPEAKLSLRQGKRVSQAKIGLLKEGREWTFSIKAEHLELSGIKLPALLSREEEEQFYERMYLAEELEDILGDLFSEFLAIRLDPARWDEVMLPAMMAWIASDEAMTLQDYPQSEAIGDGADAGEPAPAQA